MSKIKKEYSCALLLANDLIGGKWKLRILWHISHGDNRFSLLTKAIPDISQKVLTTQLKELEQDGIIERTIINDNPPKTIIYDIADSHPASSSHHPEDCSRNSIRYHSLSTDHQDR